MVSNIILPENFTPNLIVACDGMSALNQTSATKSDFKVTGKHIDLISITFEILSRSAFIIKPRHVYGHQDNLNRPLTFLEKLKFQMGELDKSIALEHISGTNPNSTFYSTKLGYGTTT